MSKSTKSTKNSIVTSRRSEDSRLQKRCKEPATSLIRSQSAPAYRLVSKITPQPVKWLWDGRIPAAELVCIEGDPGCNKSSLTIDLAARLSMGCEMPDGTPGKAGNSLLLVGEDSIAKTVVHRLEAAGADLDRIGVANEVVTIPDQLTTIEEMVDELRPLLIIIDPLMAFLTTNSSSDQAVRKALTPLKRLAEWSGASIVIVRHLVKGSGKQVLYRGGGSIGITAAARSMLMVGHCPDDPDLRVVTHIKCNLGPLSPSLLFKPVVHANGSVVIEWHGECRYEAKDLFEANDTHHRQLQKAQEFLVNVLTAAPRRQTEIRRMADENGISYRTVQRAKEKLGVISERTGFGPGSFCKWRLPPMLGA